MKRVVSDQEMNSTLVKLSNSRPILEVTVFQHGTFFSYASCKTSERYPIAHCQAIAMFELQVEATFNFVKDRFGTLTESQ